jgi:hypothetical protein
VALGFCAFRVQFPGSLRRWRYFKKATAIYYEALIMYTISTRWLHETQHGIQNFLFIITLVLQRSVTILLSICHFIKYRSQDNTMPRTQDHSPELNPRWKHVQELHPGVYIKHVCRHSTDCIMEVEENLHFSVPVSRSCNREKNIIVVACLSLPNSRVSP